MVIARTAATALTVTAAATASTIERKDARAGLGGSVTSRTGRLVACDEVVRRP